MTVKKAAKKNSKFTDGAKKSTANKVARKAVEPQKTNTLRRAKVALLSGGNPQIPKGYGDAPVQAYIAAMPGWKSAVGTRIDTIIERTVSGVHKAVKWNSPLYGVKDDVWFASVHVFAEYVKVTFFTGARLDPLPPRPSKVANVRYLDIYEGEFDEAQFANWIKQASALPGTKV